MLDESDVIFLPEQTTSEIAAIPLITFNELLDISITLGYQLLENGAEIYRVEESISRILLAYGITDNDVFAIPTCIITTIGTSDGQSHTRMKRIIARRTNLDKVTNLNDLCRRICRDKPSYHEILTSLDAIKNSRVYPLWLLIAATALTSFSFCLFYGGGIVDALVAAACGIIMRISLNAMERFNTNLFFQYLMGSSIVTATAFFAVNIGVGGFMDRIIIGTLMNLVPGVALTNSMRDIIAGDLLAGITKLTEAIMIAIAMALGTGIVLYGLRLIVI